MTSRLNIGTDFDNAVLTAAGLDPVNFDPGSITIDFLPSSGDATVRATYVATVSSDALRSLIAEYGGPVPPAP